LVLSQYRRQACPPDWPKRDREPDGPHDFPTRPGPTMRSGRQGPKAYKMLSPPRCDIPTGLCKERRRNVAAVRRAALKLAKPQRLTVQSLRAQTGKNCRLSAIHRRYFARQAVDNPGARRLYKPSWARRRLARWRVCEAPHCSHGDRAYGHASCGHVRVAASDVRGSATPG
jgi:hypothetical protein